MRYAKRWQFYRVQTDMWGLGFHHGPYEWGFWIGPFWLGKGYK
jgi:hypothetical protein